MLNHVWWDMVIWSFIKCTCCSLYLSFLPPLSISYSQRCSSKVRNMEQKVKKKRPFNCPNFNLWIGKLREYKIHDAIEESLLFYLHWKAFPGQGGKMREWGRINRLTYELTLKKKNRLGEILPNSLHGRCKVIN